MKVCRTQCLAALVSLLLLVSLAPKSGAGVNAHTRAWLSWDKAGYVTRTWSTLEDSVRLYVQIDSLRDVAELAVTVTWEHDDTTTCVQVVSSSPDREYGWATETNENQSFLNDSTYKWQIDFPTGSADRNRIAYTITRGSCEVPEVVNLAIGSAMVMDNWGAVDTIQIVGQATILTTQGSQATSGEDATTRGFVVARLCDGFVPAEGEHLALTDFSNIPTRAGLQDLGFQSGRRAVSVSARRDTAITTEGGVVVRLPDPTAWYVLRLDENTDPDSLVARAGRIPGVCSARAMETYHANRTPNDEDWSDNWYLASSNGISATSAWDWATGSDSVVVGILDSGVNYGVRDLDPGDRSRVLPGVDLAEHDANPMDYDGHGTSVAGLAGAIGNNGPYNNSGIAGVLWRCKLLPVKIVGDDNENAWPVTMGDAFRWAAGSGAQIANMSFGGHANYSSWYEIHNLLFGGDPLVSGAYAAFAANCALFSTAGNGGDDQIADNDIETPAVLPWVYAVSGSNATGARDASFNYGNELDIIAPGTNGHTYGALGSVLVGFAGTSMASPIAAATAGLVLSYAKRNGIELSNEDLFGILSHSATDLGTTGWDALNGWGRVDAARALSFLRPPYSLLRASRTSGAVTLAQGLHKRNFLGAVSDEVRAGEYWMEKYEVRQHISACGDFDVAPYAWARTNASRGYDSGDGISSAVSTLPWAEVVNVTSTGFDVRTFVYYVKYDLQGRGIYEWFPSRPEDAVLAYTAIGRIPLHGVSITSDQAPPCAGQVNTWRSVLCGGSGVTYEWRERYSSSGAWSSVVATTANYARAVPTGHLELQVTVTESGTSVQQSVAYDATNCVVDAGEAQVAALKLSIARNPSRARGSGEVALRIAGPAELDVFDIHGRRVRRLMGGELAAGRYHWDWDGRDDSGRSLGANVFWLRLRSGGELRTAKLVLLQ